MSKRASSSQLNAIYIIAVSLFSGVYSNPSLAQNAKANKGPTPAQQKLYDELRKAEQKRAEAKAIRERDVDIAANKIRSEKRMAIEKALLEKALLESVPR